MTLSPDHLGDQGQRYEVRYAEEGFSQMKTLGWTDDKERAERMAAAWRRRPTTKACIVVDRRLTGGGETVQALMDRDRE